MNNYNELDLTILHFFGFVTGAIVACAFLLAWNNDLLWLLLLLPAFLVAVVAQRFIKILSKQLG